MVEKKSVACSQVPTSETHLRPTHPRILCSPRSQLVLLLPSTSARDNRGPLAKPRSQRQLRVSRGPVEPAGGAPPSTPQPGPRARMAQFLFIYRRSRELSGRQASQATLRSLALNHSLPCQSGQLCIVSFYSFQPQSPKERPFPGGAGKARVELSTPGGPAIWVEAKAGSLLDALHHLQELCGEKEGRGQGHHSGCRDTAWAPGSQRVACSLNCTKLREHPAGPQESGKELSLAQPHLQS